MKNVLKTTVFSAFLVVGVLAAAPQAHAGVTFNPMNPIDPFCLFSCPKPQPTNVTNTINSNNSNSFNNTTNVGTNNGVVNSPYTVSGSGSGTSMHNDSYIPPAVVTGSYTPTTPYGSVSNTTVTTVPSTPSTNNNYNYNYNTGGGSYNPTPVYYQQPYYYQTPTPVYYTQPTYYTTPYQYGVYSTYYDQPTYYQQPIYNQPISYAPSLQIACAADRTVASLGQPVTWSAEATYNNSSIGMRYSWSGTEGLFGNSSDTIIAYYGTGVKSAVVTVTAPNGQMQSKVCANTVTVKSGVAKAPVKVAAKPVVVKATPTPTPVETVSAASLFSLGNVPWGWVGILIILVLLGIIFYLIFNQKKI